VDSNGHERIVVSGGRDGEESLYNFIETAILQIKDWHCPFSDKVTLVDCSCAFINSISPPESIY